MPTSDEILGFSNRWYQSAFTNAKEIRIEEDYRIRIFTAPYFLATKLEAFKGRGEDDGRWSSDFEDLVFVLNNRTTIWEELKQIPEELRTYFSVEFRQLLDTPYIEEWISSHLDFSEQGRVNYILGNMQEFVHPSRGAI